MHLSDAPETGAAEVKRWSDFVPLDRVRVKLDKSSAKPDHTYHLRSLAALVQAGAHTSLATDMMRELIAEESDLTGNDLQSLYRVILGALE